jgi:hypothetical protein
MRGNDQERSDSRYRDLPKITTGHIGQHRARLSNGHAGHRGEETPRRLSFDGRTVEVTEVLDAWLAPDHRYFKVRGDNGAYYILRNGVVTGRWELTMFDRTRTIGR